MMENNFNKINVFDIGEELKEVEKYKSLAERSVRADISVDLVDANPYQPRTIFDDVKLQELSESIKTYGVISPLLVRETDSGRYQILAGERRFRASVLAGMKKVPALIAEFNDQQMMEMSIIENVQREGLNVIEEARAYENLANNLGLTHDQIGQKVGKSRSYIANIMRLLNLPEIIQEYVINGALTMGQVKPLVNLEEEAALKIANDAIEYGYTSRQVENLANLAQGRKQARKKQRISNPYYDYVSTVLHKKFNSKVRIKDGEMKIFFKDEATLRKIMEILEKNEM